MANSLDRSMPSLLVSRQIRIFLCLGPRVRARGLGVRTSKQASWHLSRSLEPAAIFVTACSGCLGLLLGREQR